MKSCYFVGGRSSDLRDGCVIPTEAHCMAGNNDVLQLDEPLALYETAVEAPEDKMRDFSLLAKGSLFLLEPRYLILSKPRSCLNLAEPRMRYEHRGKLPTSLLLSTADPLPYLSWLHRSAWYRFQI